MRRVKNGRVIRRIADKTRKAGKGKSLIAVLAIILTTVLFTTVFTVGGSMVKNSRRQPCARWEEAPMQAINI